MVEKFNIKTGMYIDWQQLESLPEIDTLIDIGVGIDGTPEFYNRFSNKKKEIVNLIGNIFFLIPFSIIIFYTSIPFVEDSLMILESSPDPGGLPYRFIIKSIIPLSFFLLAAQGVVNIINNLKKISNG